MKIEDVLKSKGREVHAVDARERLSDVLRRFAESKIRCLVVTKDARLAGLLTLRDIVAFLDEQGAPGLERPVSDAMTRDVVHVSPDTTLDAAQDLFTKNGFHHLPVQDGGGKLVGVVTPADVLSLHLRDEQEGAKYLRDYIQGVYF